jgi:O-antigen/teichoic acid export membrane protein
MMLVCLLVALVTYYAAHITRGTLSGNGRFGAYGLMHGSEGILRIVFVGAVFAAGSKSPGLFGLALVVPPAFAVLISLRGQKGLIQPGPDAPYSELSGALTLLLVGTSLAQLMSYAPVIAANVLSVGDNDDVALAGFITGMFIARIPILLFQAVQASLLPKLAGYAGDGRHDDFRSGLRKLLVVVLGIGVIGVVAGGTLGPKVGERLFTEKWTLGSRDLALLAAGAGAFILALTLAQGLIALRGYKSVAFAWSIGIAAFVAAMPFGSDVFLRAEIAFVISSLTASALMGVLLVMRMRVATATIDDLVEVVEHEQLEI